MTLYEQFCIAITYFIVTNVGYGFSISVRVSPAASYDQRLQAARKLLQDSPLIDGHNNLLPRLRTILEQNNMKTFNLSQDLSNFGVWQEGATTLHTDLPRLRKGSVAAQVWSTQIPCESQYLNSVHLLMQQIDAMKRMISTYADKMTLAASTQDIERAFKDGRLASLIGVEGGHSIGSSMGVIRSLYELGVRVVTLTHNCHTPWAECAEETTDVPNALGLTPFGQAIIKELNRIGLILDLTHSSANTARNVLRISKAPVIFSHSATSALCDLPANVPDDVIRSLSKNGGVLLITFSPILLSCESNASLSDVVAHINHVRSIAGVDHVGIGAAFDEISSTPEGLFDVTSYPELFAELLKDSSWSLKDLRKLAGLNFLRVLSKVEEVRDEMELIGPSEEIVPIHDIDTRWICRYKFKKLDPLLS